MQLLSAASGWMQGGKELISQEILLGYRRVLVLVRERERDDGSSQGSSE